MKKWIIIPVLFLSNAFCFAQIKLPKLISDGMVLQRNDTTRLWGWASPNEEVSMRFKNKSYSCKTNADGEWMIKLPPQKAGGPFQMVFTASNTITLQNILFGDVFLCSGQSNMELPMGRLIDQYPNEIANSTNPNIRQFLVPDEYDFKAPRKDFSSGSWLAANPKNVLDFSGVAYFFAQDINRKNKVPVGIINAALGGSPAQSWISETAIKKFPQLEKEFIKFKDDQLIKEIEATDQTISTAWYKTLNGADVGLKQNWKSNINTDNWAEMNLPGYWATEGIGKVNGVIWFKKDINVPPSMVGKPAKLLMGRIVDADSVFINGEFVGTTSYQYPPRRYLFNAGILKAGTNTITIRVISNYGNGGFVLDKDYLLTAGNNTINLAGKWKYKVGAQTDPSPPQTFVRWKPVGLYNAMIAPMRYLNIKAALWYQGEANTYNPTEYQALMETLIPDWRVTFNNPNLPFLYVQLPNFMEAKEQPAESSWAELREKQRNLSSLSNTAMAVTIDLGEWNDIHPLNKKDVGKRLALQTENLIYGNKQLVSSGPTFKSLSTQENKLIIHFGNIGKGLVAKGHTGLKYFAIAGADRRFVWAKAEIDGDKVIVSSKDIGKPLFVRYAWADNPAGANLYNLDGLPASPFEAGIK